MIVVVKRHNIKTSNKLENLTERKVDHFLTAIKNIKSVKRTNMYLCQQRSNCFNLNQCLQFL